MFIRPGRWFGPPLRRVDPGFKLLYPLLFVRIGHAKSPAWIVAQVVPPSQARVNAPRNTFNYLF